MDHGGGTYFVSRTDLLKWVNSVLPAHIADSLQIKKVEQCSNGVVYAVLLCFVFPRHSQTIMSRVKMGAKSEYDCRHNMKLIQDILSRNGVSRHVEVDRIAKGNYQANLEFLQWLKTFSETKAGLFGGGLEDEFASEGGSGLQDETATSATDGNGASSSNRGDDTARSSTHGGHHPIRNSTSSPRKSVGGVEPLAMGPHSSGRDRTPSKSAAAAAPSSTTAPRGSFRSTVPTSPDKDRAARTEVTRSPSHQRRIAATTAPELVTSPGGSFMRSRSPRMVPARSTSPPESDTTDPIPRPKPTASTSFRQGPLNSAPKKVVAPTPRDSANHDQREIVLPRLDTQHAAEKLENDRRKSLLLTGDANSKVAGTARPSQQGLSPVRSGRDWYVKSGSRGEGLQVDADSPSEGDATPHDSLNDTGASSVFGAFPLETGKPRGGAPDDDEELSETIRKKRAVAAAVAAAQARQRERHSIGGDSNGSDNNNESTSSGGGYPSVSSAGNWLLASIPKDTFSPVDCGEEQSPTIDGLRTAGPPVAVPRFTDSTSTMDHPPGSPLTADSMIAPTNGRIGKAPTAGMQRGDTKTGPKGFQTVTAIHVDAMASPGKGPVVGTPRGSRVEDAISELRASRSSSRGAVRCEASSTSASPSAKEKGAVPAVVSLKAATPAFGRTSSNLPTTPRIYENGRLPNTDSPPPDNEDPATDALRQERDFYLDKLLMIEEALTFHGKDASQPNRALSDRIAAILSSKDNLLPPERRK